MYHKPLDKSLKMVYDNTARVDKDMKYIIFNEDKQQVGEFRSIYDMEKFLDDVREGRGERYPNTERMSPFDYLKSIRWFLTIDDQRLNA